MLLRDESQANKAIRARAAHASAARYWFALAMIEARATLRMP